MARVDTILTRARDTLSDLTPDRYSTPSLLRKLSEGQELIARKTHSVRGRHTIQLCHGYHTYLLDATGIIATDAILLALTAVRNHKDEPAQFVITSVLDHKDPDWRTTVGNADTAYVIYNKQDPYIFRIYPTPDSDYLESTETFNTTEEPIADSATINEAITTISNFDITLELTPVKLLVEYSYVPPPIVTVVDTNLLVSSHFDKALKHFIVGMALKDDKDTQNMRSAQSELQMFQQDFDEAAQLVVDDWTFTEEEKYYAGVTYNAVIE